MHPTFVQGGDLFKKLKNLKITELLPNQVRRVKRLRNPLAAGKRVSVTAMKGF